MSENFKLERILRVCMFCLTVAALTISLATPSRSDAAVAAGVIALISAILFIAWHGASYESQTLTEQQKRWHSGAIQWGTCAIIASAVAIIAG